MFSKYLESFRMRRMLKKALEQSPLHITAEPQRRHIQFLLVQFSEEGFDHALPIAMDAVLDHDGILDSSLNATWLFAHFGGLSVAEDLPEKRMELVHQLQSRLGDGIRIAHGECMALLGIFGSRRGSVWGAHLPHATEVLTQLLSTPFGTAIEIPEPGKLETGTAKP